MAKRLGAKAAAAHVGIGYSTWRSLRARGKAPEPDGIDGAFGQPYWLPSTLNKWMAARPGQGARTDLKGKKWVDTGSGPGWSQESGPPPAHDDGPR
jgi:hypothetical protein